jgi:hypothetical protein
MPHLGMRILTSPIRNDSDCWGGCRGNRAPHRDQCPSAVCHSVLNRDSWGSHHRPCPSAGPGKSSVHHAPPIGVRGKRSRGARAPRFRQPNSGDYGWRSIANVRAPRRDFGGGLVRLHSEQVAERAVPRSRLRPHWSSASPWCLPFQLQIMRIPKLFSST